MTARLRFDVTVAAVGTMPRAFGMDLLVVGGPTHAFGMSRPSTREQAAQQGTVRPEAVDVGVREYLGCSPMLLVGGTDGPLEADEEKRARQWGAAPASTVIAAQHPV